MTRRPGRRDARDTALQQHVDQHQLGALPPGAYEALLQRALEQAREQQAREQRFAALFRPPPRYLLLGTGTVYTAPPDTAAP